DGIMEDRLLSLRWKNQKSTFFEHLKILREKSSYTDATLAVNGLFFPVHKFVMSTCSEYFRDIFEKTSCKSPVIVLKDVRIYDIEVLLDYMYVGEVTVNQCELESVLKTAELLKIKDLAVPDEDPTKLHKNSNNNCDNARQDNSPSCLDRPSPIRESSSPGRESPPPSRDSPPPSQDSPPPSQKSYLPSRDSPPRKRRRRVSKNVPPNAVSTYPSPRKSDTALVTPVLTPYITPNSTSNTSNVEQDDSSLVKVEMDYTEEQEERLRIENSKEGDPSTDRDPFGDYEPENNDNASFSDSVSQYKSVTSNTDHDEPLDVKLVKVEMGDAEELEEILRRENDCAGNVNNDRDPLSDWDPVGDYGSTLSKTGVPEIDGNTPTPGPSSLEQSILTPNHTSNASASATPIPATLLSNMVDNLELLSNNTPVRKKRQRTNPDCSLVEDYVHSLQTLEEKNQQKRCRICTMRGINSGIPTRRKTTRQCNICQITLCARGDCVQVYQNFWRQRGRTCSHIWGPTMH
ncbi:unnamed protein product, partial [Meganyctiphanes norvegica]